MYIQKSVLLVVSIVVLVGLSGCHTASGFGQDVEASGRAIQKASR